jgi:hypothetical protein
MAGVRLGWLATRDRGLRERLKQSKDYTTICGNGTVPRTPWSSAVSRLVYLCAAPGHLPPPV